MSATAAPTPVIERSDGNDEVESGPSHAGTGDSEMTANEQPSHPEAETEVSEPRPAPTEGEAVPQADSDAARVTPQTLAEGTENTPDTANAEGVISVQLADEQSAAEETNTNPDARTETQEGEAAAGSMSLPDDTALAKDTKPSSAARTDATATATLPAIAVSEPTSDGEAVADVTAEHGEAAAAEARSAPEATEDTSEANADDESDTIASDNVASDNVASDTVASDTVAPDTVASGTAAAVSETSAASETTAPFSTSAEDGQPTELEAAAANSDSRPAPAPSEADAQPATPDVAETQPETSEGAPAHPEAPSAAVPEPDSVRRPPSIHGTIVS